MKYIIEFEDEPCMYEDEVHFYKCIQAPWWGLSERVIKQLTPYQPEPDCVSRKTALDAFGLSEKTRKYGGDHSGYDTRMLYEIQDTLEDLPAVQPERDIPIKPYETTDTAWGIPNRQAVCPKCDYYLGHVAFLGDYKGKKVTYCETCGQAIDWEGWDFE